MYCRSCERELQDEKAACPFCGSVSHLFNEESNEDFHIMKDEKEIRRMKIQQRWLLVILWIAVISFILWIIMRIFSGVPSPQVPSFGKPDFF